MKLTTNYNDTDSQPFFRGERYNRVPTENERAHIERVMALPCCGCGIEPAGVAHHVLQPTPSKRWRRDHRIVIPLCNDCHVALHHAGSEGAWRTDVDCVRIAEYELLISVNEGIL
jgi:hypothetical protein